MSLRSRALVAVLLTIGFYLLALGISLLLLLVVYLEVSRHRFDRIALFCLIGAGLILWSIVPRPTPFTAPGPPLRPEAQPRLFEELKTTAAAAGEPLPDEVYLAADVNAGVTQRGGFMGFGGRRVMILGLPLLQVLTPSQLRAVLVHEYGHYHGGDTRLGPWIYKTRETIERTFARVARYSRILREPFRWYGLLFLRITQAVSRRQEFTADELAARAVGASALAGGLRMIAGAAAAYDAYFDQEFAPVVNAGYRPSLSRGFWDFVAQPSVRANVGRYLEESLARSPSSPYDSHPPLAERLKALEKLPSGPDPGQEPSAATLLDGLPALEEALVRGMLKPGVFLQSIDWSAVPSVVMLPAWRRQIGEHAALVAGSTAASLPQLAARAAEIGQRAAGSDLPPERARAVGVGLIGSALAVALAGQGWSVESEPGAPVRLRRDGEVVEPFDVADGLASGRLSDQQWQQRCAALGIGSVALT